MNLEIFIVFDVKMFETLSVTVIKLSMKFFVAGIRTAYIHTIICLSLFPLCEPS